MFVQSSASLGLRIALLIVALAAMPASARWTPDPPSRTAKAKDADGVEITCTYYRGIVLRQMQTDTPSPGDTILLRTIAAPACSARAMAGIPLKTAEFVFVGRKGPYLLFEEANPNGATAFSIFDARDGRKIFGDTTQRGITDPASLHRIVVTPSSIRLAYRRAVNLPCSILAEPAACWRSVARGMHAVLRPIARLAPPVTACARSYRQGKVPRDDPRVVAYEVRTTWTRGGRTQVQASGPLGCEPLP